MLLSTMAATLFLLLFGNASANYNTIRGRRTNLPENTFANNRNKHLLNDELSCILLLKEIKFSDGSESEEADCLDPVTGEITKITGPYDAQKIFLEGFKTGELTSNKSTLTKNGGAQAYFDDDAGELVLPDWEQLEIGRGNPQASSGGRKLWKHVVIDDDEEEEEEEDKLRRRNLATAIGDKEMLAIRVIAPDNSTTASESEISDSWFGTHGDRVNLKSQYKACSYGQLRCEGASKTTSTGTTVTDGVYTINISQTISGEGDGKVRKAVVAEAKAVLGSLGSQFDHVMLCLPPGTKTNGGWIGYAYLNHYLSVYNDKWCNYVSLQMHEIGHNMNLKHSGQDDDEYGDETGAMGYSSAYDDGPLMCFNAPKNWQLGWYSDAQEIVTVDGWSGNLYGIADYGGTEIGSAGVIAQIPASIDGGTDDWYVSFNRKAGINAGTSEGGDQVLVHKTPAGSEEAEESTLMAKLSAGETYSGAPLPIQVSAIDIFSQQRPGFATVIIGTPLVTTAPVTNAPITPSPTHSPSTSLVEPTPSPSSATPTKSPTKAPSMEPTIALDPTFTPVVTPSNSPTRAPTKSPSLEPSVAIDPTSTPIATPTKSPTKSPTKAPSMEPTIAIKPTSSPIPPSNSSTRTITTTYEGGSGEAGNMFDVHAKNTKITITNFQIHTSSTSTEIVEIYTRAGTHVGYERRPGAWTLLAEVIVVGQGYGNPTPLPAGAMTLISIEPHQSQSFYITLRNSNRMVYSIGSGSSSSTDPIVSDAHVAIMEGVGKGYLFRGTVAQRRWNGSIEYEIDGGNAPTASPTTTATAATKLKLTTHSLDDDDDDNNNGGTNTSTEAGNMFNVINHNPQNYDMRITNFQIRIASTSNTAAVEHVEIYHRKGSHRNYERRPGAWTKLNVNDIAVPVQGHGVAEQHYTPLPPNSFDPVIIAPGEVHSFYIALTTSSNLVYSVGSSSAIDGESIVAQNSDLAVMQGVGKRQLFAGTVEHCLWNGVVEYEQVRLY